MNRTPENRRGIAGKGRAGTDPEKRRKNDEGKRERKRRFSASDGGVLPLIEYVVKADIFLDMLALIFTGFNDSAENVLLRGVLALRIVIFGPLFYLAMFYGG